MWTLASSEIEAGKAPIEPSAFARAVSNVRLSISGQRELHQGHCVDVLLDLYNLCDGAPERRLIESALRDMRNARTVRADRLMITLNALGRSRP